MKAQIMYKYGGPEVFQLEETELPKIKDDELLVKIVSRGVNPADWHRMRAKPYFMRLMTGLFRPKEKIIGTDFAGTVEKIGAQVTKFNLGDRVYGECGTGSFAEYNNVKESNTALVPESVSLETAGSLPVAALTAYQGVVTHGKVQRGDKVLVNGSSGGVGHLTVQIAKALGAEVTGVCSSKNLEFVKNLGADHVIDYTTEDIHKHLGKYDIVIDTHGNLKYSDYKRMVIKKGVTIGFVGMGHMMKLSIMKMFSKGMLVSFVAKPEAKDLNAIIKHVAEGKIAPKIDRTYTLGDLPKAIEYIETMHSIGKTIVTS